MRKLPWGVISIVAVAAVANVFVFTGCGSDETPGVDPDSGASSSGGSSSGGSSSGGSSSGGSSSSSGDAASDGAAQDGDIQDGQACALAGQNCTQATASTCCSKVCNAATNTCAIAVPDGGGGGCFPTSTTCTAGPQCCSGSCVGGTCSATACKQDTPTAEACTANDQCCSGKCGATGTGPTCLPLGGGSGCRTEGNTCTINSQCCSGQCGANGKCINVSFCQQTNDVCANDYDCCGGTCNKTGNDTLGRCGTVSGANCKPAGTVCSGLGCDNTCCSLSCGPYGTSGVNICQPPSGCKPQDELCLASGDCCGGPGQLPGQKSSGGLNTDLIECVVPQGETFGRCEGAQCLRPGAVCKAPTGACGGTSNNCCESILPDGGLTPNGFCNSTPEACCSRDALGIPRCRGVNFVCNAGVPVPAGSTCTTSADCCGKPCVNGKCEGACVAKGGSCTVSADCCSPEPCVVPTGQTMGICGGTIQTDGGVQPPVDSGTPPPDSGTVDAGTCALYGQTCTASSQCCNGVPCSGGFCRFN